MHSQIWETARAGRGRARRNIAALNPALVVKAPKAMLDKYAILPILSCVFALIIFPLLIFYFPPAEGQGLEARPETRFFWPAMAVISLALFAQHRSRVTLPPHIICLFVYLAFAGASVLWAFRPESSFVRFAQQAMIIISIVLPAMLASRTVDMMRGLFVCFSFALILNGLFVLRGSSTLVMYGASLVNIGYEGYFKGKNYLGECATLAFLLSCHEIYYRGWRRVFGIFILILSVALVYLSNSKTALGLALVCPFLAAFTVMVRRLTRVSPAVILLSVPLCFAILSSVSNFSFERMSYILYGDSSLTGRTVIWDFANTEIARSPIMGWGYQSFWLVPGSPAVVDAPGWVKMMPNAHNGYIDTKLELGYVGLSLLVAFLLATLHATGRVADRDPARARLVLSLVLFIILYNFFESLWMRGFEFLWVVFVIVAAEIARYWKPFLSREPVRSSGVRRSAAPDASSAVRVLRPDIGIGLP